METALKIEIVTRPVLSDVERWLRAGTFYLIFLPFRHRKSLLSLLPLNTISTGSSSQDIVSFLILTPLLPSTGSACLAVSAFPSSRNRSSFDHWSNPPQSRSCPSHNLSPVAGPDLGDSNQCQDNWLSQSQMSRANTNTSRPARQNSGNCVLGVLVRWSAWWLSVLAVVCHTVRRWQQT